MNAPVPVQSSAIQTVQFDPRSSNLRVVFTSGKTADVTCDEATYKQFLSAESKGQFWNSVLRSRVK